MPISHLAVKYGAKGALAAFTALLARNRIGKRTQAKRKAATRRPTASAGMRPWVFPKLTMPRGVYKDFVFCFDGSLNTTTTQRQFGTEDVFKLNDCFDPAVGGATGQPLYWDQY